MNGSGLQSPGQRDLRDGAADVIFRTSTFAKLLDILKAIHHSIITIGDGD
jgi:hypothetical protein